MKSAAITLSILLCSYLTVANAASERILICKTQKGSVVALDIYNKNNEYALDAGELMYGQDKPKIELWAGGNISKNDYNQLKNLKNSDALPSIIASTPTRKIQFNFFEIQNGEIAVQVSDSVRNVTLRECRFSK
jgi:hypothetical protein